jgi:hypothetical protein
MSIARMAAASSRCCKTWTNSQPTPRLLLWPVAVDVVADLVEATELLISRWIISPGVARS